MNHNLQVMKFGGTSVGNAECIRRAAEIVARAAREASVVAVVSAMGGVTNRLIEAAHASATGDLNAAGNLAESLQQQHDGAIEILIGDADQRAQLAAELKEIIADVSSLCRGTALLRELTPRTLDAISSAGERLSARLLASALRELGVNSVAVEATELIVTDNQSGRAEPLMAETRQRASARLAPLLAAGAVPVVTGFIGATVEGKLTTLGRGGSDYSATILGAALDAKEIIIWTDVDGVLTADPRLVPEARTLQEISYNEAAELAYFGAKVLHPKTLRPVSEAGIPVWIRNSFLPERNGTQITATGHPTKRGVKAITAMTNVTLITVGGRGIVGLPGVAAKTFTAAASAQANVLLISQSSSGNDICFIIDSGDAARTVTELRGAFAADLAHNEVEHITVNSEIAIVAVVGDRMRGMPGIAGRTFSALGRRGINIIAIAQGSSEYNVSLVIEAGQMREVVQALHGEFDLQRRASRFESIESESTLASASHPRRGCRARDPVMIETEKLQPIAEETASQLCIDPECGASFGVNERLYVCPRCGGLLDVELKTQLTPDPERLRALWTSRLASFDARDRSGVWRYRELLPFVEDAPIVTLAEGNTPLYDAPASAAYCGLNALTLKHQGCNPTGSFKDTGMTAAVTQAVILGARTVVCASTGNTAASLAAYAARAHLQCAILVPRGQISHNKLAQSLDYGAAVLELDGNFDDAMRVIRELAEDESIYLVNSINPFRIEGQKTVAAELLHQRGWRVPDHVVVPGGNLGNSSAFGKGFRELMELGLIERLPRLSVIQADGAAPFADLFVSGSDELVANEHPQTLATAIKIGAPVSWKKALRAVVESRGSVLSVSEQEIADAKAMIGRDGVGCEPASATTVAGIKRLVASGTIGPDDDVVAVLTGHILKDTDYAINYHQDKLYTHDRAPDKTKEERRLAGTYSNPPARVKATKAAILDGLRRHEQEHPGEA